MSESKNILQRLSAVMSQVEYIKKEKNVSTGGDGSYKAVTHDQVAGMVRGEFVKNGIVIVPRLIEHTLTETGQVSKSGVKAVRIEAIYEVNFCNADDKNDLVSVSVLAHGIDSGDKAPGKVLSYAVKYAILKVLLIETGEDDESRYGGEESGMAGSDIVTHENLMRAAKSKDDLRAATLSAMEAAEAAGDHAAHKHFIALGKSLAEKIVDTPRGKSEQKPAPAAADDSKEPRASAALVKMIENTIKAKDPDAEWLAGHTNSAAISELSKSKAATLLKALEAL